MAGTTSSETEGGLFARLLIILYALGLVAIGAQPIQKEYGSFTEFLRQKSQAVAGQWRGSERRDEQKNSKPDQATLRTQTLPTESRKTPGVSREEGQSGASTKNAPADNLTEKDRKALNQLINGL